jgi:diaminopimelate epimerase
LLDREQAMAIAFLKMHGLGNDFVVIDGRAERPELSAAQIRALADRRRGIGCDQLIMIEPAEGPGDAFVRFWNADGGETGACGNGSRCVAALVMSETGRDTARLETVGGVLGCAVAGDGLIVIDMGTPRLDWQDIPLAERMDTRRIDVKIGPIDKPFLFGPAAVGIGNPHCVFFVDNVAAYDLEKLGPLVESHPMFPERTNVGFAEIRSPSSIRLRVWERGAGVTQACGTGACAALVAAVRRGLAERRADLELDGGVLGIEWRQSDDHVLMTGPVAAVYQGLIDLEALEAG